MDHKGNHGLYEPLNDPQEAIIDIIFVHGLHGNRETTWTNASNGEDVFWPKDLLAKDIPQARIFTWGYDSSIAHFWASASQSHLNDHSTKLLVDLADMRKTSEDVNRPIILVAHSLGGLVCANALLNSTSSPENYIRTTASAVRGIMFLATPHAGSSKAKWIAIGENFLRMFKSVNKDVTKVLEKDSVRLAELGQQFPNYLRLRGENKTTGSKIETMCFFEEYETKIRGTGGLVNAGMIVSKESAKLAGYDLIGIPANHSNICKFSGPKDSGYLNVLGALKRWIEIITAHETSKAAGMPNNLIQHGSTFYGGNQGGVNVGNANSFGSSAAIGGSSRIFDRQQFFSGGAGWGDRKDDF